MQTPCRPYEVSTHGRYEIWLGRSSSPKGPYLDKAGRDMAATDQQTVYGNQAAGGEPFLKSDMDGARTAGQPSP